MTSFGRDNDVMVIQNLHIRIPVFNFRVVAKNSIKISHNKIVAIFKGMTYVKGFMTSFGRDDDVMVI